jgi:hypothetical protein
MIQGEVVIIWGLHNILTREREEETNFIERQVLFEQDKWVLRRINWR